MEKVEEQRQKERCLHRLAEVPGEEREGTGGVKEGDWRGSSLRSSSM